MHLSNSFRGIFRVGYAMLALALVPVPSAISQTAKTTVSDAQVEAGVLKFLANAPDLASQPITTTTVYGVVTLSGSVQSEAQRTEAENLTARTAGVQKVVDELTLSPNNAANVQPAQPSPGSDSNDAADTQSTNPALQSDGTYASASPNAQQQPPPPPAVQQNPAPIQQQSPEMASEPNYGPGAPSYRQPYNGQHAPPPPDYPQQNYPQQGYPQQQQYPQQAQRGGYYGAPAYAGQTAGEQITVPAGALVRIRINQTLDTARTQPGDHFDGIVVNDVAAAGAIAIPRGATVHGMVVDAKKSGAIKGRGELSLQLISVDLGGVTYPIASDVWTHNGADKSVQSVDSTLVGGILGALVGAAAGGGQGAAIGAGVGGAAGLGVSATSHNGQVFVPSEGLLTFHLAQPAAVATVSQEEMDRLAQGAGPASQQRQLMRRRPYYPAPYPPR